MVTSVFATGYSPGKVILSGEHSAVYGEFAVAGAIGLGVEVAVSQSSPSSEASASLRHFFTNILQIFSRKFGLELPIDSVSFEVSGDLPLGSGLGSSAALAHAAFRALAVMYQVAIEPDRMIVLIQESESWAHGHPSGLDAATVVSGELIQFHRTQTQIHYQRLQTSFFVDKKIFLIQSGKPAESSKEMIALVREKVALKSNAQKIIQQIGQVTKQVIEQLEKNTFELQLMTENERLLESLGVVSKKAREMIGEVEKIDGVGKVTGAGGVAEGSGIILALHQDEQKMRQFLNEKNWQFWETEL